MPHYIRVMLIATVCLIHLINGCGENKENQAQIHIESARQYIAEQKPQTAIVEYRNAVQLDPKNDVALFELAEAYILTGQIASAIRYYNLSAKVNPGNILPHLRLAQINIQTNQLMEARDHINKVLSISPTSVEAYHLLSGIQIAERDIDSAIETLNKAISLDNKNIKTYISLARLYLKQKSVDKAENAYMSAISHDPSSREAYMGLARLYGAQKKWNKAETLLKGMLETPGIEVQKYTDLARFYQGRRQFDLAEKYFQEAILKGEDLVEPLINLAEFYTRMGKQDKAIVTMRNALSKQPKNPLILTGLAQIYLHFNKVDEAEKAVNRALSIDRDYTDALFQQGKVLMAKENYKEALNRFDQIISMNQVNAKAYYYRALCIKNRGASDRPEQKIFRAAAGMLNNPQEFEKDQIKGNLLAAITVDPTLLDARLNLMEMYILEKNVEKAREQMEEIFKLSRPNIRIMTLLSGLQLIEGDIKGAENILKSIIQVNPDFIPAYIRLGMLYRSTDKPELALEYFQKAFNKNPNQIGLVRIMAEIYMGQEKYIQALDMVSKMEKDSSPSRIPFFENIQGEVYLANNQPEKAFNSFSKSVEKAPKFITPKMHMAKILSHNGEYSKALELYKDVETINPKHTEALFLIGFIHDTLGDQNQAELYYRKVLELESEHLDAANNLAFILSEKKDSTDEALRYASIARDKAPKNPNVLDTIGWVYYQKGNYLNALSELEESLKINPDSALACFHYGMALYRNQEFEKARVYFKKALDLDPGFKDATIARSMLN